VPGTTVHGIGEPLWADRSPAELAECQLHEALLNAAFAQADFRLMCPYDATNLGAEVLEEARRTHPLVYGEGCSSASSLFPGLDAVTVSSRHALPDPPSWAPTCILTAGSDLVSTRRQVAAWAAEAGLSRERIDEIVLAANEMATNTLRYGGFGTVRSWWEPGVFLLEFNDPGRLGGPMVGRFAPHPDALGGRGFWLANHLCDLVQIRVGEYGSIVRLLAYL
jgi:anti-sigma regulatory factor (Ser/Thr protein kinase)